MKVHCNKYKSIIDQETCLIRKQPSKCWTGAIDPICAKCTEAKQIMSIGELEIDLLGLQVQLELCLTKVKKLKEGSL